MIINDPHSNDSNVYFFKVCSIILEWIITLIGQSHGEHDEKSNGWKEAYHFQTDLSQSLDISCSTLLTMTQSPEDLRCQSPRYVARSFDEFLGDLSMNQLYHRISQIKENVHPPGPVSRSR